MYILKAAKLFFTKKFVFFVMSIFFLFNSSAYTIVPSISQSNYRSLVYSLIYNLAALEQYHTQCSNYYLASKWQRHIDTIQYKDHPTSISRNKMYSMMSEGRGIISKSYEGCPYSIRLELYYLKRAGIKASKELSYINAQLKKAYIKKSNS